MTRDRIHIRNLRLRCLVGVHESERLAKQDVLVSLTLEVDLARAGATDDIADTVDYDTLAARVKEYVQGTDFRLIERLAEGIADVCLAEDDVERVHVFVEKPGALPGARCAAVEIVRDRDAGS